MKARAIRKRLMRGRVVSFWGRRAYFTVRVQMSVYPSPLPQSPSVDGFRDDDISLISDDGQRRIFVGEIFGSAQPDQEHYSVHFLEQDNHGWWRWWEAVEVVIDNGEHVQYDVGEDIARSARDRKAWIDTWVHGFNYPTGRCIADALIAATWPAKTVYVDDVGSELRLTYSVKWFYPDRVRAFCSAMARAFRVAKTNGVEMRWTRA